MSGDWLRLMMLRAVSSVTWVRNAGGANSSLSSTCQPSSTACGVVTSNRPGRWPVAPRPLIALAMPACYGGRVSPAGISPLHG